MDSLTMLSWIEFDAVHQEGFQTYWYQRHLISQLLSIELDHRFLNLQDNKHKCKHTLKTNNEINRWIFYHAKLKKF